MVRFVNACLLLALLVIPCKLVNAQPPTLELSGGVNSPLTVKYNDPSLLGTKSDAKLDYSEVRGKYMWDNEWSPGLIVMRGGHATKMQQIKLNLYTQEIHYMSSGTEMVAAPGLVNKLVLYSREDTTAIKASFINWRTSASRGDQYYEEMNAGSVQLLKMTVTHLKKLDFDPSKGESAFRFFSTTDYFIKTTKALTPLKSFGKATLSGVIEIDDQSEHWLSENKNKLKNEHDTAIFLGYLGSRNN